MISRRGLLGGFGAVASHMLAAPAIVRCASLMPVKAFDLAAPETTAEWLRKCEQIIRESWDRLVSPPVVIVSDDPLVTRPLYLEPPNFRLLLREIGEAPSSTAR